MKSEDAAIGRKHMQTRTIRCDGYRRDDGLYEVEAVLIDTKPYAVSVGDRDTIPAGEPFHEMRLRLVVNGEFQVREAITETVYGPYTVCGAINPSYQSLVGLTLGPGFTRAVSERLGGTAGCVHLNALLRPAATTVMQMIWHVRDQLAVPRSMRRPLTEPPPQLNQCHALRTNSPTVKKHYPQWHSTMRDAVQND